MPRRSNGLVDFSKQVVWPLGALTLFLVLLHLSPLPLKHVFVVIFTAVLLAAAISPAARFLGRYNVPRGVTILVAYVVVFLILGGVISLIVPLVLGEVTSLEVALPQYAAQLQDQLARISPSQAILLSPESLATRLTGSLTVLASELTDLAFTLFSTSITLIIILVMTYFMAAEENFARLVILRFVPPDGQEKAARLMGRIGTRMGEWARAQLLLALFFGVAFGLGLKFAGVHYAVTLATIGGVLEIIPYVGGFITVIVAVLVALSQRPILVIWVLVWYFIVVEIEGHILAPKLMDRVLGIHPLVIILALFLGGESLGLLGALFAVPLAIVVQVMLDEFYSFSPAQPAQPAPADTRPPENGQGERASPEPAPEEPAAVP